MAEDLIISTSGDKQVRYSLLIPQIAALIKDEHDVVANLANITAALKYGMGFFWVGFYLVKDNMLVLGPFQGPIACTRIAYGKGVCGSVWQQQKTIIVEDVDQFPGHIACSTDTKSEIVLPAFKDGQVALVLDIDSNKVADFNETDKKNLSQLIKMIEQFL